MVWFCGFLRKIRPTQLWVELSWVVAKNTIIIWRNYKVVVGAAKDAAENVIKALPLKLTRLFKTFTILPQPNSTQPKVG